MIRITLTITLAALLCFLGACTKFTECDVISSREAVMLIDVTDRELFDEIKSDLNTNLPVFMQKTGLAEITSCEQFTLTLVPITSKEGIKARSESIAIVRKGQSFRAERAQANPAPLVSLIRNELSSYQEMTGDHRITSGSNIANVMLKAITGTNPSTETTLIVFSDMIENNSYLNMYQHIPDSAEIKNTVRRLIDPIVMEDFRKRQASGANPTILIVCKENPLRTVDSNVRDVRTFWSRFFKELDIDKVSFLDNLSNIN